MKERPKIDLGMTGYDELFMNDQERAENRLPKIYDIPLTEIDDFPDHPFQVRLDEDMDQLVESVKERGIITPITLRKKDDGRYEIVSGHRRRKACELAGFETIPAEIKELTRDEAIILMVESNLQRSVILPSEKAFSYKMRMEAMNRQGKRSDLTSGPVGQKLDSRQELADNSSDSARQIQRYIRLTYLIPDILRMVDEGKIALRPAVELSYLNDIEQLDLVEAMDLAMATPSHAQAIKMRNFSREGKLTPEVIESIMYEEKPNQKEKINIRYEDARRYDSDDHIFEKAVTFESRVAESPELYSAEPTKETMTVLLVEPNQHPRPVEIGTELEDLQNAVGGYIEVVYPFDEPVGLVMNEEGKLDGLPLNRALRDDNGEIYDVVAGSFLVVGLTDEDFGSLTPDQMKAFEEKFHSPEVFIRMGRGIMAVPLPDEKIEKQQDKKLDAPELKPHKKVKEEAL